MNITESNNWFAFLRSLETNASPEYVERGRDAAAALTKQARKALNAGPYPNQVEALHASLRDAVDLAGEVADFSEGPNHEQWAVHVALDPPTVVTVQPTGDRL